MPQQETFLIERANDLVIEVVKTYDPSYAREVFGTVGDDAKKSLATALEVEKHYAAEDIPDPNGQEYEDFLWEELSQASLEDVRQSPRLYSFFVVTEAKAGKPEGVYVSADWPSAEEFAKGRLARES